MHRVLPLPPRPVKATASASVPVRKAIRRVSRRHVIGSAARQIAASAVQQLQTLTRTSWLRAVSAAVAVGLVAFVTGVALGLAWGSGSTARTVAAADAAA